MCYNFNPEGLKNYEILLCESYDNLITWIFDEAVIIQKDDRISKEIISNYNKLPLNL